jgi:hypothetical protein
VGRKFGGLVSKHPAPSGFQQDDSEMGLYWNSMRTLYTQHTSDGLPRNFHLCMSAYFFLSNHPKFGAVLEPNDKSGMKKMGCCMNLVSDSAEKSQGKHLVLLLLPILIQLVGIVPRKQRLHILPLANQSRQQVDTSTSLKHLKLDSQRQTTLCRVWLIIRCGMAPAKMRDS